MRPLGSAPDGPTPACDAIYCQLTYFYISSTAQARDSRAMAVTVTLRETQYNGRWGLGRGAWLSIEQVRILRQTVTYRNLMFFAHPLDCNLTGTSDEWSIIYGRGLRFKPLPKIVCPAYY